MFNPDLSTRVHEGMDVLDMDGTKIGKAGEIMPDGNYFNVDTGFLGIGKEYYVPFNAIEDIRENAIYLNVPKGNLDAMGWDQPPTATGETGATGTSDTGRTMEVPVSREEAFVERRPVERRPADQPIGEGENENIRVPVREDQLELEKQPVAYEEVSVGKRQVTDTQRASDTVRREELRTEREGNPNITGETPDERR